MDLSKILSISGKNGLYKLINQGKNSVIVESLEDEKRFPAFSHEGIATLDNISIFTYNDDVSITSVFQSIYKKENGGNTPDFKGDSAQMKRYFEEILPQYDKERVYVSNIKKIFSWYNLLNKNKLIDIETTEESTTNTVNATESEKEA